jgi:hypothetical protein
MAIITNNTQNANTTSSSPRIISVYDTNAACPSPSRTNPILTATVTVARPSYFWVMGNLRRLASGRTDSYIYFVGPAGSNHASGSNTPRLNYTAASAGISVAFDGGYYGNTAGTYTISLTAASPTAWGCGATWGQLYIMVMEV